MGTKCGACERTFTGASRPIKCERCEKSYHTPCCKLISVRGKDNVLLSIAKTVNSTNSHGTSIDSRVTSIDNRMVKIDKKLGDMADRLLVAENEIQDSKADVAAVNTKLATAKAETLRRFEVLEQQQDSVHQRLV